MIGLTVRHKESGALCVVKRDGINNYGRRQLRLRALDGGPLLFVEPDEVEVVDDPAAGQPNPPTGLADEDSHEAEGQAEGYD